MFLQLKRIRHHFNAPRTLGSLGTHLEADPKVTGILGHAAKRVHGA